MKFTATWNKASRYSESRFEEKKSHPDLAALKPELVHARKGVRMLGLERLPLIQIGHRRILRERHAISLLAGAIGQQLGEDVSL